ncbi:MAG: phosphoribosylaminoimidazolesuccinocarboxamide synthase, partial [Sporolactobacillus sp.]
VIAVLQELFTEAGILLVDFKLEFGKLKETGAIVLADEISPDTCRLWDKETHEKLDKDVFRRNIADLPETYEKLLSRLEAVR